MSGRGTRARQEANGFDFRGLRADFRGDKVPSVAKAFSYGLYTRGGPAAGRRQMPAPDLRVPLDAIRREAELARDASSLRAVAREVDITPMGLRAFLMNQGSPQARTVRKLNSWYVRRMARHLPAGEDEARAALAIFAGYFPESERQAAALEYLEVTERRFRAIGMKVPPWVENLQRAVQTDPAWLYPPPRG